MSFLTDVETWVEELTGTTSVQDSASKLLTYIIGELQTVLNAPNQHEKLQETVNGLTQHKDALAAAVAADPDEPQAGEE